MRRQRTSSGAQQQPGAGGEQPALNYSVVDAYSKLVALLVKYMHSGGGADKVAAQRISLLNKVLGITVRCLMAKSATAGTAFDQRPYVRERRSKRVQKRTRAAQRPTQPRTGSSYN